jgi:hypothetical protein
MHSRNNDASGTKAYPPVNLFNTEVYSCTVTQFLDSLLGWPTLP